MLKMAYSISCALVISLPLHKVRPVLNVLGENVFHLGTLGSGHTIKLINNFFGMTVANAMAEAFAMADVAGISREDLYDVMAAGPLRSGMMVFVKAYGVDGDSNKLAFYSKERSKRCWILCSNGLRGGCKFYYVNQYAFRIERRT